MMTGALGIALLSGCSSDGDADAQKPSAPASGSAAWAGNASDIDPITPFECDRVPLGDGATIYGKDLSACVVAALHAYGTGTAHVTTGDRSTTSRFRIQDDLALTGDTEGPDGRTSFVILGDHAWLGNGGTWVQGDPDGNADEVSAASLAEIYRAFVDPQVTGDLLAASGTWKVEPDKAPISLENGENVMAWRIVSNGPFDWNGARMSQYTVWLEDDATPVGTQGVSSLAGTSTTTVQHFYDLGKPITIEPPV